MRSLLLLLTFGFLLAFTPTLLAASPLSYDDAPLHGVQFVDKNEGWAVGEHGLIWHSIDGGKSWERQPSGTTASLRGICFLTPYIGWVVGRAEFQHGDGSVGVVLHTTDGGLTWSELSRGSLPGLNGVRYFDETHGIVWGDSSDSQPAGAFQTADGGKTWQPITNGERARPWLAGAFTDASSGVVAGGKLAAIKNGKLTAAEAPALGGRSVRGLTLFGNKGIAVGDGGLLMTTEDGGTKWAAATLPVSAEAAFCWDFHCAAAKGQTMLAAGSPGSVIARSTDEGRTWKTIKTGWQTPIHALYMLNETHAWAVGDLGVVLATTDGGLTWQTLRNTGSRAGLLFVNAYPTAIPLDVVAMVGAVDGYNCSAIAVCGPVPALADPNRAQDMFRVPAAVRRAGGIAGETGWAFPVPAHLEESKPIDLLHWWDELHEKQAHARLVRRLTLACRMWRPEVIVSERVGAGVGPAEQLVLSAMQEAFKKSEDAKFCPEQLEELGLGAAAPKKLYALGGPARQPAQPEVTGEPAAALDLTKFDRKLLDTPRGFVQPAFAILGGGQLPPASRAFRLISHRLPGSEEHKTLMEGIVLAAGGPSRKAETAPDATLEILGDDRDKAVAARRQIEAVAARVIQGDHASTLIEAIKAKLNEMPADLGEQMVLNLARQMAAVGRPQAATMLYQLAVARFAGTAGSLEALRWLCRTSASAEHRRRVEKEGLYPPAPKPGMMNMHQGLQPASLAQPEASEGELTATWPRRSLELEANISMYGSLHVRDPRVVLAALAARRELGLAADAGKVVNGYFQTLPTAVHLPPGQDLWRDCMAAEAWIRDPAAVKLQPKPLALCPRTAQKPRLDGQLNDECWKAFAPLQLQEQTGPREGYSTQLYLTYDDEFFYLAAVCQHPEGKQLPRAEKRRRDENLAGHDRIELLLDIDRDYQSYFRLRVDQRGCVADDCTGDFTWNPRWFVAVDPTPTGWTAEVAIPLSEFVNKTPSAGTIWGMNVTRIVPGVGVQTWSGPPAVSPRPEGAGLMRFHQAAAAPAK